MMGTCEWIYDEEECGWESGCGELWMFNDKGPKENGCKFCMFCGKPLGSKTMDELEEV